MAMRILGDSMVVGLGPAGVPVLPLRGAPVMDVVKAARKLLSSPHKTGTLVLWAGTNSLYPRQSQTAVRKATIKKAEKRKHKRKQECGETSAQKAQKPVKTGAARRKQPKAGPKAPSIRGTSPKWLAKRYAHEIGRLHKQHPETKLVILTALPRLHPALHPKAKGRVQDGWKTFNSVLEAELSKPHLAKIRLLDSLKALGELGLKAISPDGLHLTALGKGSLRKAVAKFLKKPRTLDRCSWMRRPC